MIYFDNSASSFHKPAEVINAVKNALSFLSANPGRSGHSAAMKAANLVYSARSKCAEFLGLNDPNRVIFTDNCTGALNLAILGSVKRGGHVVTTVFEHNSVLRPLFELKRRGIISLSVAQPDCSGVITADAIERLITPKTYLVAVNHVSNVTGAIAPIHEIGKICRKHNILFSVDGAQSVGYVDFDMQGANVDMLAVAPHKGLHAPQGVGVLCVSERVVLRPVKYGGTGTASHELRQPDDMPEGFESGTLPTPAIAGLCAAIGVCRRDSFNRRRTVSELSSRLRRGLSSISGVKILSPENALSGITAFNIDGLDSESVSDVLSSDYDICVRAGLHCAPLAHEYLGTLKSGAVRVSLGYDNTAAEIDFFLKAVKEIAGK